MIGIRQEIVLFYQAKLQPAPLEGIRFRPRPWEPLPQSCRLDKSLSQKIESQESELVVGLATSRA